ncbi:CPBP family intramembrane glutamic endopeptidase [Chloroflexus sp. Y-396-1]|uniref:CPBP family intramembrane glutamic endopeptidase n=1 Tax=Chloroflexus sp. Y-396-1 TaxID=867845 RepID=UPI00048EDFBD|nr:type II CAAX endopeptidase family protein [Chloroflexus sp. Y-396-1]
MSKNIYLALADQGKNAWWRYLVGMLIAVAVWIVGSALITLPLAIPEGDPIIPPDSAAGFALALLSFGFMLLGVWLATTWIHRRPFGSLIGPSGRLNGRRIWLGAGIWGGLLVIATVFGILFFGDRYTINPNFLQHWPFLLISLMLLPLQTSAEEFLFRGYVLQATGRLTNNWLALSVLNGVLFTLPHLGNPEAEQLILASLSWFSVGIIWTLVTLRSGSLDYALGAHLINNLLFSLLFSYEGGALPAVGLFVTSDALTVSGVMLHIVSCIAFYWITNRIEAGSERQPVLAQV